ncbi:MAG: hypothetical protein OES57_16000, partial [Acidimicrobiia bacterium]|nr:hypothetical protein [Acidimicrobiia bacterium]
MHRWRLVALFVALALIAVTCSSSGIDELVPDTSTPPPSSTATPPTVPTTTSAPATTAPPSTRPTPDAAPSEEPTAGAHDLGDPYVPGLGNGGYDVEHYRIDLTTEADNDTITGVAEID